jgi:hypothetical protein
MPGESNPSLTAGDGYGDIALIASYWLVNMALLLDDRQLTLTSGRRGASSVCSELIWKLCRKFKPIFCFCWDFSDAEF